jgi:hypothetical protein
MTLSNSEMREYQRARRAAAAGDAYVPREKTQTVSLLIAKMIAPLAERIDALEEQLRMQRDRSLYTPAELTEEEEERALKNITALVYGHNPSRTVSDG